MTTNGDDHEKERATAQEAATLQELFGRHLQNYPIRLQFPATVGSTSSAVPRTSSDLINFRLIESGLLFDDAGVQTVEQVAECTDRLVKNLQQSGCFHNVQVHVQQQQQQDEQQNNTNLNKIHVVLEERNWYKLYIGGGIKNDGKLLMDNDSFLPKLQFETKGSLLNVQGVLDVTSLEYCVDQTSTTSLRCTHDRPLYTLFASSKLQDSIIEASSELNVQFRAEMDTMDHEWTRSYKEFQRTVGCSIASTRAAHPELAPDGYLGMDWTLVWRDVIPRRSEVDYSIQASPDILRQSGPSVKHSLVLEARTNGALCDDQFNPTQGLDVFSKVEVAGPPGDVGFVKVQGGAAMHYPLTDWLSVHTLLNGGCMSPVSFGGLCQGPTVSDKFSVNGLRGFSGIGPRAKAITKGGLGDALGGELFYTGTVAASTLVPYGVRLFGFATAGTLTNMNVPLPAIVASTRASVGAGVSMGTGMGRLEATYAWPIRYGPRDARRALQFGFGFSMG